MRKFITIEYDNDEDNELLDNFQITTSEENPYVIEKVLKISAESQMHENFLKEEEILMDANQILYGEI